MVDTVKEVLCYREKDEMQTKRASLAEKESDSPLPNYLSHITPYQPQQSLRDYWGWGTIHYRPNLHQHGGKLGQLTYFAK